MAVADGTAIEVNKHQQASDLSHLFGSSDAY